jgi:hypothetical protein
VPSIKSKANDLPFQLRLVCDLPGGNERYWRPPRGRRGQVRRQHSQRIRLLTSNHHLVRYFNIPIRIPGNIVKKILVLMSGIESWRFCAKFLYKEFRVSIVLRTQITTTCEHISEKISLN